MSATNGMINSGPMGRWYGSVRLVRVIVQLAAIAAAFGFGFAAGLSYKGLAEASHAAASQDNEHPMMDGPQRKTVQPKGVPEADELLVQLDLNLRDLAARQRQIESSAKEDRIAYNLLRKRGYTDDSIECERLVNRQKQMSVAAAQAEVRIVEARQLQRRLHEVLDAAGAAPEDIDASDQLIAEIQQCLLRGQAGRDNNLIPGERWSGGPDLLMKQNKDNHVLKVESEP